MSDRVPVYILAGGQSRRFGSDKARATLWGKPLIHHVADAVEPFASSVTVVAREDGAYDDLGLRTIGDLDPGRGPVAGLLTALSDSDERWLLLTSCDFVGLHRAWIERLVTHQSLHEQAVAYRGERWEPMLSMWRASVIDSARRALNDGRDSLRQLLDEIAAKALDLPEDWPEKPGVNTPEELERWV